jgi:threonine dehydrogenase-like Zn-dependent dehydrogenase
MEWSDTVALISNLLTHTFSLNEIKEADELFGNRAEDVIKLAIKR